MEDFVVMGGGQSRHWPKIQGVAGEPNRFTVLEDYWAHWMDQEGTEHRVMVPAGFVTNMASSPRIMWWIVGPFDLGPSAVIHDWFYHTRGQCQLRVGDQWQSTVITRRQADWVMRQLMRFDKSVAWWRRKASWWLIRRFGLSNWTRK